MLPDSIQLKDTDEIQAYHSHEEAHDDADIPVSKHRKLKWKLDLFILPLISSVYFFASMGRSDLANAKVAGLSEDIHISPQDYSNAATILLVGYIVFQLPGTVLLKQIGPSKQFAGAMVIWGALTAASVSIQNTSELLVLRFFIGIAEAFVQGGVFYLSFWYQYSELATRGAIFYSMSTLAGAFNGLIAYGITKNLNGANGWKVWRWIFLIEGILPCAFAFVVLFLLPDSPESLRFGFNPEEKALIVRRARSAHNTSEAKLQMKKIPLVLMSLHFWLLLAIACCGHFCIGSMSNFLPAIIEGFGYNEVDTQMFTVIVYVCGGLGILFWAQMSDRSNARGLTLALSTCGGIAGYAMLVAVKNDHARFAATCLVAFSIYPSIVLQLAWCAMSFIGYTRRGASLAFMNVFSQLLAICGTQAYNDPPYYRKGHIAALGLCCCNLVLSLVLRWYFGFLNRKKDMRRHTDEANRQRQESFEELGGSHPDFHYTT